MKYLLLLVVVFVVLWWLRGGMRRRPPADAPTRTAPGAASGAQPMVTCAHCGVHLPQREAVSGARGAYCSDAHRLAHGDGTSR